MKPCLHLHNNVGRRNHDVNKSSRARTKEETDTADKEETDMVDRAESKGLTAARPGR